VHFTREPIIETIISPKDGYKLCVRSSRGGSAEEYFVDAIEVVSFGRAFFFRSLERPKSFLVPVTDYEVIEVKETRVALKNISHEKNIKIGGGREAPVRVAKEVPSEKFEEPSESSDEADKSSQEDTVVEASGDSRSDKKRDRRRHRRRRLAEERREWLEKEKQEQSPATEATEVKEVTEGGVVQDEAVKVSSSMFSTLFPPPPTLISETIARYKEKEGLEGAFFTKPQKDSNEEESAENLVEPSHQENQPDEDVNIPSNVTSHPELESDE
jgi:hypothetical protein